jgi:predicted short-subunit dehydrogenase-like oxidoreductase (DUF2520 family)
VKAAEEIVGKLGGKSFSVAAEYKPLYHAAAVTACGHLVALIDAAVRDVDEMRFGEKDARTILTPLIKSTVSNLESQTTAEALTGTFARADVETLRRHLEILQRERRAGDSGNLLAARRAFTAARRGAGRESGNLEKMRGQILLAKKNLK